MFKKIRQIKKYLPLYLFLSFAALFFAGVLLAGNFWLEYRGMPRIVLNELSGLLRPFGLVLKTESCKLGVFSGIILRDIRLEGKNHYEYPTLTARKVHLTIAPWRIFSGTLLPFRCRIENGTLELPLLPEYGKEAETDTLTLSNLNADIGGDPGVVVIHKAKGKIQDFEFSFSGTIDNFLHLTGAQVSELLHDKLMEKEQDAPSHKNNWNWYRKAIDQVPLAMRKYLILSLDKFTEKPFDGTPKISAFMNLDLKDFKHTNAEVSLYFPDFRYGYLNIGSIREKLVLRNGILEFNDLRLDLGKGEHIIAQGRYDSSMSSVSGTFSGTCSPKKMLLFVDESARETLTDKIQLSEEKPISFQGTLNHLSILTGEYSGTVQLKIPAMTFNGIALQEVSAKVELGEDRISGVIRSTRGSNHVEAAFRIAGNAFGASVKGKALPESLRSFFSKNAEDFIYTNIKYKNPKDRITFQGQVHSDNWKNSEFEGKMAFTLPQVFCHGLEVNHVSASISFTPTVLKIQNIEAKIDDSLRISGDITCLLSEQLLNASVICRGSPGKTIQMLEQRHKSFLESLTSDIRWPPQGNLMESTAEINLYYGDVPAYFITGTLVMTDFYYRDIHFLYGATRFLIDSDRLLVLPAAILQTKDGHSQLTVSYKAPPPGAGKTDTANAGEFSLPEGIVTFSIDSTMSGNDIMRCLYPEWKSEFIDFPQGMKVSASGVIDYKNESATTFSAEINNGICFWKGIRISDLDSSVKYENNTLYIDNATASVCDGRITLDYRYDFTTMKGAIDTTVKNAGLASMIKDLNIKKLENPFDAQLSGTLKSSLYYGKNDLLHMDGSGTVNINGQDLWSVPFLGDLLNILGKAWNTKTLGNITEVNCAFHLNNETLTTTQFKTDGSVVALTAAGFYLWNTNEFDFRIRAELLKGTLPFETMSKVLSPISWILERRIKGKLDSYNWQE